MCHTSPFAIITFMKTFLHYFCQHKNAYLNILQTDQCRNKTIPRPTHISIPGKIVLGKIHVSGTILMTQLKLNYCI